MPIWIWLLTYEIVVSAYGFSGQKCSACSRAIVHQVVYDQVLEKVIAYKEVVEEAKDVTVNEGR